LTILIASNANVSKKICIINTVINVFISYSIGSISRRQAIRSLSTIYYLLNKIFPVGKFSSGLPLKSAAQAELNKQLN